ncbi:unnamed protein product [Rotaria sordida]|uniref:Uncharacterized protein n=1 Tax=Rotaria sordida TaxID=392033 RepID=A0A815JFH2_9BILA|nr:unnamed protein product [Rotaria sordida]CAF4160532.1 unnamed protein product [Rotaria sordida]
MECTPNIRFLSLRLSRIVRDNEIVNSKQFNTPHLRSLQLIAHDVDFKIIVKYTAIFRKVQQLRVETGSFLPNGLKWEEALAGNYPNLKDFVIQYDCDSNSGIAHTFNTMFWKDKKTTKQRDYKIVNEYRDYKIVKERRDYYETLWFGENWQFPSWLSLTRST